jgi:bifunctional non-homologous end joining protein LigD
MPEFMLPAGAVPARTPREVRLQIVTAIAEPPEGSNWLHEIKHDGHRLVAIVAGGTVRLLSRNGHDRSLLFGEPFKPLATAGLPAMVLDGEIAVPDERGVTHIDALNEAITERRPEWLAYFAFDLLHFDGHDLKRCPIEDRKALLRDVIGATGCERVLYVDHIAGLGSDLLEAVNRIGAEGIVSKSRGSLYRRGTSRDWLKTKVFSTGLFVITGFGVLAQGRLNAVYLAEEHRGGLIPAGTVQFGLARKGLLDILDRLRDGPAEQDIVPVRPELTAEVKYFGRIGRGFIRDGVLLGLARR